MSASTEVTSPLMEAVRQQLRAVLDRPMTARTLFELEQTAKLARDLLVLSKAPDANGVPGVTDGSLVPGGMIGGLSFASPYTYGSGAYGGALAPSSHTETFGASMIRELVAALPALMQPKETIVRETASSLVDAIAAARDAEMDDVADKLKARLDALLSDEGEHRSSHAHYGAHGGNGVASVAVEAVGEPLAKSEAVGEESIS